MCDNRDYPTTAAAARRLARLGECPLNISIVKIIAANVLGLLCAETYAHAADSIENQHLSNVEQVTSGYVRAGEGYFSPDARSIVFQAVPSNYPFYQIFVQAMPAGEPRRISPGRGRTTCSYFSPDGKRLIFASSHLDPHLDKTEEAERQRQAEDARTGKHRRYQWDFDPYMDIFESDLSGKITRQLTSAQGYDAEGAFSPDGKLIAFCSKRDGDADIYLMNADGSNVRQLTNAPGYDGGPFISPDGKWVVYRSDRKKEGYLQIHAIDIEGNHDTPLTDNIGVNWAPYWHPTEPYIIWTGADHTNPKARPNYDLWLMRYEVQGDRIAPGKIERITNHPSADVLPVFSPDGKKLMWTSGRGSDGSSQLWIADINVGGKPAPH